jgi:hypothetical protein
LHGELKIIIDEDDKVSKDEMMRAGAVAFTPTRGLGETQLSWNLQSREKTIETLNKVLKILQKQ